MRISPPGYIVLLASLIGASGAAAADPEKLLERVIVTASRAPELATRRAVSTIVIDRQQIEQQNARDVAELLRFHAGFDIGRNGGPGQVSSVFVRGAESNHVLVLVDGVRISPGTIGVPAIQNIDPDLIERIEIVKGPRSTLYGSDAIGAVINVFTRRDSTPKTSAFSIGAGSFDTLDLTAQNGFGDATGGGNIALSLHDTEGFSARSGAADKHGHSNVSVNASLWRQIDQHTVEISAWRSAGNTEYADFFLQPLDQDFTNQSIDLRVISDFTPGWKSALSMAHFTDDIQQNQMAFDGSYDFLKTTRVSADWQNTLIGDHDNHVVLGLYGHNEKARALSFGTPIDENTRVMAAYGEFNRSNDAYDASLSARFTEHDDFGSAITWHTDLGYYLTPSLQLLFAAGTGFRAPDATDRFGFGGNNALDPEASTTLELGLRYQYSDAHLFSVRAFDQKIDDLINYVVTDFVTFAGINQNIDQTRTRGIEFSHEYRGAALSVHTEAIVQDPKDETTGLTLLRRAERSITTNILYPLGFGTAGLSVLASGERPDIDSDTFSRVINPGYVLASLTYSRPLARQWTMRVKVENLLDTGYQTADGFENAERSYFLEFAWQAQR